MGLAATVDGLRLEVRGSRWSTGGDRRWGWDAIDALEAVSRPGQGSTSPREELLLTLASGEHMRFAQPPARAVDVQAFVEQAEALRRAAAEAAADPGEVPEELKALRAGREARSADAERLG